MNNKTVTVNTGKTGLNNSEIKTFTEQWWDWMPYLIDLSSDSSSDDESYISDESDPEDDYW